MNKFILNVKRNAQTSGFTLVETLVAITILMIAVAGPLVVASKGLNAAIYAKDLAAASFLAQEGMELVRNGKDIALSEGTSISSFFSGLPSCEGGGAWTTRCAVSISSAENVPSAQNCSGIENCLMHQSNSGHIGYAHDISGYDTPFRRYFYYNQINNSEYRVTVVVTWEQGGRTNTVQVSSQMTGTEI